MKKIISKPCQICGAPVFGIKRADRNSNHFPKRCVNCLYKTSDEVKEKRINVLNSVRRICPIGSTRLNKSSDGFVYVVIKTSNSGKWKYEHRVIMESILGRNLTKEEHVHHINEQTTDNRPENLIVLSSSDHIKTHIAGIGWSRKYTSCKICGTSTKIHMGDGLCSTCYQKVKKDENGIEKICKVCGSNFKSFSFEIKRGNGIVCSRSCAAKYAKHKS